MLDANIFLEVELGQDKSRDCEKLLRKIKSGELKALTTDFIIDSIIIVMENYGKTWKELRRFLSSLLLYRGLKLHHLTIPDRITATQYLQEFRLDFDDATTYHTMKTHSIKEIISYDAHFDRMPTVNRVTPKNL